MLLFDKKLLKTTRLNQIVVPIYDIEDKKQEGDAIGYLYCDLPTYQQAVTLSVRFEDEVDALRDMLLFEVLHTEAIDYWKTVVPKPLDMLAPYLGLVTDRIEMSDDMEELVGYMHVLGKSINFSSFIAVPKAARVNVTFGKTTFALMKEELVEYRNTLRERDLCEKADDIVWVSSEEIGRVATIYTALSEKFLVGQGTIQQVTSAEEQVKSVEQEDVAEIDLEDDWSGYVVKEFSTDWSSPSPMITTAIETIKKESNNSETKDKGMPNDLLANMVQGTINSHNV